MSRADKGNAKMGLPETDKDATGAFDLRVSPVTVRSQTVAKLREAIEMGQLQPGERLVETALCQRMGVSRTSIREALRQLEAEYLVTNTPNIGPSVAIIDWKAAEQIYEVRRLLEGEVAALCAERASPDALMAIERAIDAFEEAVRAGDAIRRIRTTEAFYDAILDGCGNAVMRDIVVGLNARVSLLRVTSMSRSGRANESTLELRRIYEEIAKGNAAAARSAAQDHVRSAAASARKVFADRKGDNDANTSAPAAD